ncbi:MAG TPA: hypothetical protein ENG83_14820 [Nitrospirae bacterium]|nr:hypothetical protein BMS3Abin06_02792 [bacterium BMS3Abin06]HDH13442.1 hypothetical protein [Nitrospirota bacterium]HDZ01848.1 hypothetical protein [Nitrospirota bacterium]
MKLPGSNRELKEVFRNAKTPAVTELNGEYLVDMLTVFPSLKKFSHRKVIYRENERVSGYNILFNKIWGRFIVEEDICKNVDSGKVAVINYNRPENSLLIRGIRDHLRFIEKDLLYIGRFNYLFLGRLQFLGYFSLEKIK